MNCCDGDDYILIYVVLSSLLSFMVYMCVLCKVLLLVLIASFVIFLFHEVKS